MQSFDGFILLDKPLNISSFKALWEIKKYFEKGHKVGHTGTLDPLATGLLVVACGKASKFIRFLPKIKMYRFSIQFGFATDSGDLDGAIIGKNDKKPLKSEIESILSCFIGEIIQIPNKFSSVKINGQRAYELARRGIDFQIQKRAVQVYSLKLVHYDENYIATFEVECSDGLYVRTLASDMCYSMNVFGCVVFLRRFASNGFYLENFLEKLHFSELKKYSLDVFYKWYRILKVSNEEIRKMKNGIRLNFIYLDGVFCLQNESLQFCGLVQVKDNILFGLCLI